MNLQKLAQGKIGIITIATIVILLAAILGLAYWQLLGADPFKPEKVAVKGKQVENPEQKKSEDEPSAPSPTSEDGVEGASGYKAPIQLGELRVSPPDDILVFDPKTGRTLNIYFNRPSAAGFHSVRIYRSTAAGALGSLVYDNSGTSFSDTGLSTGTTYYYTLRSVDIYGRETSNKSQYSGMPTDTTAPSIISVTGSRQTSSALMLAQVSDEGSLASVVIYYRPFSWLLVFYSQPMVDSNGDGVFEATILLTDNEYEYYIEARDYSSNITSTQMYSI